MKGTSISNTDAAEGADDFGGRGGVSHSQIAWMGAGFFDSNFKPRGAMLEEQTTKRMLPAHISIEYGKASKGVNYYCNYGFAVWCRTDTDTELILIFDYFSCRVEDEGM